MWLLMGVEPPLLAAFIARMPDATANLAAYGLAFALVLIIEAPIIMILSASTAFAKDAQAYRRLLGFMHIMAAGLTAVHLVVASPRVFTFIAGDLIGAPAEIVAMSRLTVLFMIPWSSAIGYRRLWQGILIRYGRTKVVPITMIARLVASGGVMAVGYRWRLVPGAHLAGIALSAGVIASVVVTYLFVRPLLRGEIPQSSGASEPLGWKALLAFYIPLALTSFIFLANRPIVTTGIARALYPLESLAVWPVINGFLFLFVSVALSYQEATVSLLQRPENLESVRRFCVRLAAGLTVAYLVVASTPLAEVWFRHIAGITPELLAFTRSPVLFLSAIAPITVFVGMNTGVLIQMKRTPAVTKGVIINSLCLVTVMFAGVMIAPVSGLSIAAIALTAAVTLQWLYLSRIAHKLSTAVV